MALLNVTKFYDEDFFSQLGEEFICTGFMYDMAHSEVEPLAFQLSSWDFSGVITQDVDGSPTYNMGAGTTGLNTSAPDAGSMGNY